MTGDLPGNVPVMVRAARLAAGGMGYTQSCSDEVGMLLELLVSQFTGELVGEIGGGAGVGTAWMAAGLQPDTRLVSVEIDETLAASTRQQFADHSGVAVIQGDWRLLMDYGLFAMLFVDVAEAKQLHLDEVIDLLRVGGLAVIDDLPPVGPEPDPLRKRWFTHHRLRATELTVSSGEAVILATKLR